MSVAGPVMAENIREAPDVYSAPRAASKSQQKGNVKWSEARDRRSLQAERTAQPSAGPIAPTGSIGPSRSSAGSEFFQDATEGLESKPSLQAESDYQDCASDGSPREPFLLQA